MGLLLVVLFVALPFAELAVIVASADAFGLGWTFLALVGFSLAGAWLLRREGASIWRRANEELAMGRMPARQLLDGSLVLAGGALLLTPGFITDAVGLAMLLPPIRAVLRPLLVRFMTRRAARVGAVSGVGGSGVGFRWAARVPSDLAGTSLRDHAAGPQAPRQPSARVIDLEVDPPQRPD